jgi:crossover junction endodeoxyribonuclease RuvC
MDPPCSRNCGLSIIKIVKNKAVLLEKFTLVLSDDKMGRLEELYVKVDEMIKKYLPICLCLERSFGGGLAFVRGGLNEAVGVTKLCCFRNGIPVEEVSPAHLKVVIGGHGKADKNCIMTNIMRTFDLKKTGVEHECDAAAFALTYLVDRGWDGYSINVPFDDSIKKKEDNDIKRAVDAVKGMLKAGVPKDQISDTLTSLNYKKPVIKKALKKLKY